MFFRKRKQITVQPVQQQSPTPAPEPEVHPSLSETKSDLDRIFRELETVVPRLQRHLQDHQVYGEPELASMLRKVYVEVETGKGSDALDRRPQLAAALADARRQRCPVAVAKLDRLSRDVHFISGFCTRGNPHDLPR